ncbi:MAG TPA: EVE domain-containing protein [Kofleriaceae bacterium]|jgi:predicted RNA-binding protein with PUA-like domain
MTRHWLMKTEPETFSIDDLARVKIEPWSGVRNPMARNFMREMQVGDGVLFYHSSCTPPGVAGLARVATAGVIDATQFDPASPYYDPKATPDKPRWDCVDVEYNATLPRLVPLPELRGERALAGMMLFTWSRLSVMPVSDAQYAAIIELAKRPAVPPAKRAARRPAPRKKPPKSKPKPKRRR